MEEGTRKAETVILRKKDDNVRRRIQIRRIKFLERRGRSIKDILVSGNLWNDLKCGSEQFVICMR